MGLLRSTALIVVLTGCTPSITERAARDVSRAFADAQFRQSTAYDDRSTMQRVASDPRVRADLRWFCYSLGHSFGRSLGRLLVP